MRIRQFVSTLQRMESSCQFRDKYGHASSAVIYAGENVPSYKNSSFINFHDAYQLFAPKEEKFRLHLQ